MIQAVQKVRTEMTATVNNSYHLMTSSLAITKRSRCRVGLIGQKWKMIFCRQYRSIVNHCEVIGLQSYRIRWNNAK